MHPNQLFHGETQTWQGKWWLPENPDQKSFGTLTYRPNVGFEINLVDSLETTNGPKVPTSEIRQVKLDHDFSIFHGEINRIPVTLCNCRAWLTHKRTSSVTQPYILSIKTIKAKILAYNSKIYDINEASFASAKVTVENLNLLAHHNNWTFWIKCPDDTPAQIDSESKVDPDHEEYIYHFKIKKDSPSSCSSGGKEFLLSHSSSIKPFPFQSHRGATTFETYSTTSIEMKNPSGLSIDEALKFAEQVRSLTSFATSRKCGIVSLELRARVSESAVATQWTNYSVPILYTAIAAENPESESRALESPFFTTRDIDFETLFPKWLNVYDRYSLVIKILEASADEINHHLETGFLLAIIAVESLHKLLEKHGSISPAKPSVKSRKIYLRDRITSLINNLDKSTSVKFVEDPYKWSKDVAKVRNSLSHEGTRGNITIEELDTLSSKLRMLITMTLLKELGAGSELLTKVISEAFPNPRTWF